MYMHNQSSCFALVSVCAQCTSTNGTARHDGDQAGRKDPERKHPEPTLNAPLQAARTVMVLAVLN